MIEFLDVAGSSCGALFPTGNFADQVDGLKVSMVDNGMPVVVMRAADFGRTGYETPEELEAEANASSGWRRDVLEGLQGRLEELPSANELVDPALEAGLIGVEIAVGIFFVLASAAYWIGASADEFFVTPGGTVGSIGVMGKETLTP